jgi:hypothetical protein
MIVRMRPRLLVALLAAAAALAVASAALGALGAGDKRAVKAGLAGAKALQLKLAGDPTNPPRDSMRIDAARDLGFQEAQCLGLYKPSTPDGQRIASTLLGLETLRILQRNGFGLYETFVAKQRAQKLTDARLRTAQRALGAELAAARKLTSVDVFVCNDLRDLAKHDFSEQWLTDWAKAIDKKAGVDEAAMARTDKLVRASLPALRSAGLNAANAKLLLDAETGDIFADVLTDFGKPASP